jgi:hypothetical protein
MTEAELLTSLGFTPAEFACWDLVTAAANAFFTLPQLHQSDVAEVAQAVHIIQYKLLSRPTYRQYLARAPEVDFAKAAEPSVG